MRCYFLIRRDKFLLCTDNQTLAAHNALLVTTHLSYLWHLNLAFNKLHLLSCMHQSSAVVYFILIFFFWIGPKCKTGIKWAHPPSWGRDCLISVVREKEKLTTFSPSLFLRSVLPPVDTSACMCCMPFLLWLALRLEPGLLLTSWFCPIWNWVWKGKKKIG